MPLDEVAKRGLRNQKLRPLPGGSLKPREFAAMMKLGDMLFTAPEYRRRFRSKQHLWQVREDGIE